MADQTPGGDPRPEVPRQRNPEFSDYPRPQDRSDRPKSPPKPAKKAPAAKAAKETPAKKVPTTDPPAKKAAKKAVKKATKQAPAKDAPAKKAPAKKAPVKKAGKAAPVPPATDRTETPETPGPPETPKKQETPGTPPKPDIADAVTVPAVPVVPPGAWVAAAWAAVRQPDEPPRRLAELAVAELGPRAAAWAAWLRETYPEAPTAGLARLAARQASYGGWGVALLDTGGPLVTPIQLSATAWVRVVLVLRIAAAYGHAPSDPRRVDELLELLQLQPQPEDDPTSGPYLSGVGLPNSRLALAGYLLGRLRRRRKPINLVLSLLLAASEQANQLERLAHRADRYYRSR